MKKIEKLKETNKLLNEIKLRLETRIFLESEKSKSFLQKSH